jgi:hypothetical protein
MQPLSILGLRLVRCSCGIEVLVRVEAIDREISCPCGVTFSPSARIVVEAPPGDCIPPYRIWTCPRCNASLLSPSLATGFHARCPCGCAYPGGSGFGSAIILDVATDAVFGDDPLLGERLL